MSTIFSSPSAFLCADWPAPKNVRAGTTLRSGPGVSAAPFDRFNLGSNSGDAATAVTENRRRLLPAVGLPAAPCWLRQVHGIDVVRVDASNCASEAVADACVTDEENLPLAVLTADCLPVLFSDERGSEVAAAHAGWRGLAAGVLEATVRAMHSSPENLLAWLGPAAGPGAYEIGAEVREAFLAVDSGADIAFSPTRENHWRVDLYALARQRLAKAGVRRIFGGGLCTISDPQRFYSHRRDQRSGRMASLIWREK